MKILFVGTNRIFIVSGMISALLWGFIAWMSLGLPQSVCFFLDKVTFGLMHGEIMRMVNGFHYDTNNHDMPTVIFLIVFVILFLFYMFTVFKCEKGRNERYALGIILFFAVVFRIILLPSVLIHENDIYRYLWDGKSAIHNVNPYKFAPADLFMYESGFKEEFYDEYRDVTIKGKDFTAYDKAQLDKLIALRDTNPTYYARLGHWQVPTIYPPAALDTFFPSGDSMLVLSKYVVASFYLILLIFLYLKKDSNDLSVLHKCFCAVAGLFILNPVGDPWYFCWVIPFLCVFPYRSWILLSGLLVFSYINFRTDLPFVHWEFMRIPAVSWVIYMPFLVTAFLERLPGKKLLARKAPA